MAKLKKAALPKRVKARRTLREYKESLKELGYRPAGSGAYADVFVDKDTAIKIALDSPNYEEYLSYVLAYQDNPHFPKIISVHRYNLRNEDRPDTVSCGWTSPPNEGGRAKTAVVVKMEKLKEFKDYDKTWEVAEKFQDAQFNNESYKKLTLWERQAARVLRKVWKDCGSDLGGNNAMLRGRTVVITDPVYG